MTVSKAYSLLEAEGLLERRRGAGMRVAQASGSEPLRERVRMLQPHLAQAAGVARQLEVPPDRAAAEFRRALDEQ
jgi:GntR family transcriptional regulator